MKKGTLLILLGVIILLGYWLILIEPVQSAILAGKMHLNKMVAYGTSILAAIVFTACTFFGFTSNTGSKSKNGYWQWTAIGVIIFIIFTAIWISEL